jgi:hypothetical protein
LRQTQFFGEQLQPRQLRLRLLDASACFAQGTQVTFAGDENVFGRMPAGNAQQLRRRSSMPSPIWPKGQSPHHRLLRGVPRRGQQDRSCYSTVTRARWPGSCARMARSASADAAARIYQQDDDVGALDLAPGAFDTDLLDRVFGFAQPAVSITCSGMPSSCRVLRTTSRVVPGKAVTIASRRRQAG